MPKAIVTLPESTGLTILSRKVLESYRLDVAGYHLVDSSTEEWLDNFNSYYGAKEGLIFPLWQA